MKTFLTACLAACLLLMTSCDEEALMPINNDLVGTWKATTFEMGNREVPAYISLAFYPNQQFSFKMDLPIAGDLVRPFKWGGIWSVNRAGEVDMLYEGATGFMGTMSEAQEIAEKFQFSIRNDQLIMDSNFNWINFNLNLAKAE